LCSLTETGSVQGHLDVSVFTNELNTAVKAPNASSDATNYYLHNNIFGGEIFIFLDKVFEYKLNHGGDSDEH